MALWTALFDYFFILVTSFSFSVAISLSFNGSQYLHVTMPDVSRTEAEDISMRFKTQQTSGLLFTTTMSESHDRLELLIHKGRLRFILHIGNAKKSLSVGRHVNNDEWHFVSVERRGAEMLVKLDDKQPVTGSLSGIFHTLQFDGLRVGAKPPGHRGQGRSRDNFVGHMQKFVFNGQRFFEMARSEDIENIEVTATFDPKDNLADHALTIKSSIAYLTAIFKPYATFTIYFQFKTTQPDGIILYSNGGQDKDFLALEIYNGRIRYLYNTGGGTRVVKANLKLKPLNDNKWHEVMVTRPTVERHLLRVDGELTIDDLRDKTSIHFDVDDKFYIGGVPKEVMDILPSQIESTVGYQGCLASFDLGEGVKKLLENRAQIKEEFRTSIVEGCEGPSADCEENMCFNGGSCVQEWNRVRCNCDMTSFTGPYCIEESTAYRFGSKGGIISFTYPQDERKDREYDSFALGFISEKDGVIIRIDSATSNDYIEMEMVDGNIFLLYNMGSMDIPLGELFVKVNDGKYHVVRFTRSGPNATVQVDDHKIQHKHPQGQHMSVFNDQARIYVGGKKGDQGQLKRPFQGIIAGLVYNKLRLLDRASEGDQRVYINGDVTLEIGPLRPKPTGTTTEVPSVLTPDPAATPTSKMLSTMGTKGVTDDLISSGSTPPECEWDDCSDVRSTVPDDGIIKPTMKIRTTPKPPSTTPSSTTPSPSPVEGSGGGCDDEEECGSGSGQEPSPSTTDDIYLTSPETAGKTKKTTFRYETGANRTVTDPVVISVEMTEATTRRTVSPTRTYVFSRTTERTVGSGSPKRGKKATSVTLWIILGVAGGVLLALLVLAYAVYKYKSKDEGTYKIDESKNYDAYEERKPMTQSTNGCDKSSGPLIGKPVKKKSVKEWYV